jgi:diguanylate cyclase (GGDEF)-like protein/PAS domain S-box-containing protein
MRLNQRNLTLVAMGLLAFLMGLRFVFNMTSVDSSFKPVLHGYGAGLGAIAIALLSFFYWRGYDFAAKLVVLALTFTLPVIFNQTAFDELTPQGIWIPFVLALVVTDLPWALLVGATTVVVLLANFPKAFHSPLQIGVGLTLLILLIAGRLAQSEMLRETVSARRRAEESEASFRENELKYRLLSEQAPMAIQVFAPDGRTLRVNQAWESLWGVSFADLANYNLFADEQLKQLGVLPMLEKAFTGERVEIPVIEYTRRPEYSGPGEKLWIRAFAYPLRSADGKLREVVLVQEDVSERIEAEERIRSLAYFDPLTSLPNRRLLTDRLSQALAASKRSNEFGALCILDLDHFKTLNDTLGHDVGDQLLIEIGKRLSTAVREMDTVSRFGGDEFVLILEELGEDEVAAIAHAELVAEKILDIVRQPCSLPGRYDQYQSSTSIGIALFNGKSMPPDTLLKQADVALYQAKGAGRNTIRFFNPEMQATIEERLALEAALKQGLANREFQLLYQPQFDLEHGMVGVEALLRWHSAKYGTVSPAKFIPLAEESGLILQLGGWVMETACAQLAAWARNPLAQHLHMSVNVSARQFMQPDFVEQVRRSLERSGAAPAQLKLELTESVVLDNLEGVIVKMLMLNDLGVSFALDDFGTGYSSLAYLKRLPLAQLKIDQSFVRDIDNDPNDAAIVRAILAMSASLGIQAIAEGVETESQRDFLFLNGCTTYQGYLFGKPMACDALEEILQRT